MINLNYIFHSSCQFPISLPVLRSPLPRWQWKIIRSIAIYWVRTVTSCCSYQIRLTGSIMTQIYVKLILFSLSLLNACCPLIESLCESDAHTTASPEKKFKWNCSEWGEPTKTIFQVPLYGTCIRKIFIQFKLEHRRWLGDHQEEKREEQELEWRNWNLFELHKTFLHLAGGREKTTA